MKKANMKYMAGILAVVTVVVGAIAGGLVSASYDADIDKITKTISMDDIVAKMEAMGFEVAVDNDVITAYNEETGKTVTIDCPDGECQWHKPTGYTKHGMGKHFWFKTHGDWDNGDMEYDAEAIKAKWAEMKADGYECPMKAEGFKGCDTESCPMMKFGHYKK